MRAGRRGADVGLAGSAFAAAPAPLPWQASAFQDKYQPLLCYDHDGCYPSSAVDPTGWLNGGLRTVGDPGGDCRHLGRADTYARTACDPTWCAYVYAVYFEKDQGPIADHRHAWESVVVRQRRGQEQLSYVSASAHGQYDTRPFNSIEHDGNRANRLPPGRHQDPLLPLRRTGERPEAWGKGAGWDRPALVSMEKLRNSDGKAYNALKNSEWGNANFPIQDKGDRFWTSMSRAKPSGISFSPTYDHL
ncbi:NPP1 family protein [Streptomyces sp. NPDC087658]|uniref:NPP1 family protein n=1 Tax=Streptomyces sp. NPDC087658 TaxID=3365800 RepID=UPI00382A0569